MPTDNRTLRDGGGHGRTAFRRFLLAGVFAPAAVAKLADRARSEEAVADFGIPDRLVPTVAFLLPVAELAVAGLLVPASTAVSARLGRRAAGSVHPGRGGEPDSGEDPRLPLLRSVRHEAHRPGDAGPQRPPGRPGVRRAGGRSGPSGRRPGGMVRRPAEASRQGWWWGWCCWPWSSACAGRWPAWCASRAACCSGSTRSN